MTMSVGGRGGGGVYGLELQHNAVDVHVPALIC